MLKKLFHILFFTTDRAIFLYKFSRWFYNKNYKRTAYVLKNLNITLNGCEISPAAIIGSNPTLCHSVGIVIGDGVIIGDNVKIFQNVTLGTKDGKTPLYPKIGNNVTLFAGSVIVGNIQVGDNCRIGANSVVLKSVPSNSIVTGIPAKLIK